MLFGEHFTQIDGNLLIGIQQTLGADWLTPIMKAASFLGEKGWMWILLCLALTAFKKTRRIGIVCSLSLLVSFILCNGVIKMLVDRPRPWEVLDSVKMLLPDPGDSSFPSGHANCVMSTSWAFFLATSSNAAKTFGRFVRLHRWAIASIALALLTCLSRVYLGMHFPSDVLAGMLVGMLSATIIYTIFINQVQKNGTIDVGD